MAERGKFTNVAVLFNTKRDGLRIGNVKPNSDGWNELLSTMKAAAAAGKGITFFVWERQNGAALTVAVDERGDDFPQRRGAPGYRPIREGTAGRPISTRQAQPAPEPENEGGDGDEAPAPAPAPRPAGDKGRALKSVFEGLD